MLFLLKIPDIKSYILRFSCVPGDHHVRVRAWLPQALVSLGPPGKQLIVPFYNKSKYFHINRRNVEVPL